MTRRHPQVPTVRTRLSACDRRPRRCVRLLVCSTPFPLASSLPSTFSAGPMERPLVRRLPRYYEAVRLPAPVHYGRVPWVHRTGLAIPRQVRCRASRVPYTVFLRMPEVSDPAGSVSALPERRLRCGLPRVRSASAPRTGRFRGAILCLHVPLSTLRRRRYRRLRMTRGQCGWLILHCQGLAPFTTVPACPGAYPNACAQPPPPGTDTRRGTSCHWGRPASG